MSTGQRIKERRKQLAISAEILAKKLSVSPATVYRWEKGDIEKVPMNILPSLSDALQTTPQYLMEWTDDPEQQKQSPDVNELMSQFVLLSPEQKRQILDYAAFLIASRESGGAPHT